MPRALLLIDYEEEWRSPKSEAFLGDLARPIARAREILDAARRRGIAVIYTRHEEPSGSPIFGPGTPGAEIVPELAPRADEPVLVKNKISPFYRTPLEEILGKGQIDRLFIAGIMTNLCVRSAVADAYDRGFGITVVTDACASDSAMTDSFTFDDLHRTRPEVRLASAGEVVGELAAG